MAKVMIDAGHGGTDPGASGNGLVEKVWVLEVAKKLEKILKQLGHDVRMTRNGDQTVGLTQRANLANRWGADIFISVHFNAGGGFGWEDFIYNGNVSNDTHRLQSSIHEAIKPILTKHGLKNRGKKRANFAVLRQSRMPAILLEAGFVDTTDNAVLKKDSYKKDMAIAVANGVQTYLGKDKVTTPEPAPNKPKPKPKPKPSKSSNASVSGAKLVKHENGRFTVTASGIKVRTAPSTSARQTGMLKKGNQINYDAVYEGNGYRWLRYKGASGNVLYVPYRPSNDVSNQWGTFGGGKPASKPKPKPKPKQAWTGQTLRRGSKGAKVTQLQEMLSAKYYYPNKGARNNGIDGHYGAKTADAVRRYQMMHNLTVDGIAGRATYNSLRK